MAVLFPLMVFALTAPKQWGAPDILLGLYVFYLLLKEDAMEKKLETLGKMIEEKKQ